MGADTPGGSSLAKERAALAKMSHLHWVHWLIVLLSLLLTVTAWHVTRTEIQTRTQERFQRAAAQLTSLVREGMEKYEDALRSGVALIHASGEEVSLAQWARFSSSLEIERRHPGINGIGVIYPVAQSGLDDFVTRQQAERPGFNVHPQHSASLRLPITFIEPADMNAAAIGLDIAHETNRLTAALKARDTGTAQITGPIILVQDENRSPGFLFYMPYYSSENLASVEQRQRHFSGLVYAPFVFSKLIDGVLEKENRMVRFSVRDGQEALYDEADGNGLREESEFRQQVSLGMYGRRWEFEIWESPEFRVLNGSSEPLLILIGGLTIDSLLFGLFVMLTRSNRRAIAFASRMSAEANRKAEALQKSNEDLERFAYVASHDLKTPLRGIAYLAGYLREDLEPVLQAAGGAAEVENHLDRLEQQVQRMEALISGILSYSALQLEDRPVKPVDTRELVIKLVQQLGLRGDQTRVTGSFPKIETDETGLEQVLSNLLFNAVKYHHQPEAALITVSAQVQDGWLTIDVSDNGPGIAPKYHRKIFEMFQTLQAKDESGSTGIGLAIVQKTVERYGGVVRLASEEGLGATFTIVWPLRHQNQADIQKAA